LRHIGPWASSGKLPGLPKAPPLGELSPKVTERALHKYDLLQKYEQKPEKALPFPVPVCYNFLCLLQKPEVKQRSQEYDKKR